VTAYVESGAGVSEGARTGLANLVTGGLFLATIVFVPLIAVVGQSVPYVGDTAISPAIAPALVLVGFLMIRLVAEIDWRTPENALPAFLIVVGVPMTFSIAAGIGLGVIGYAVVMVARGRAREIGAVMWLIVALFGVYFASDWLEANVF
jgi:AGZA family xanthine/uracil permease-like MFS transporter